MDEKKVKKWGMRIYYVLAILFFVFIHVPFGYAIGGLMTLAEPSVWFYILSVGIAISYLGRFGWIYPLIYWPYVNHLINYLQDGLEEYGDRTYDSLKIIISNDLLGILIVLSIGLILYLIRNYVCGRVRNA